jgi:putative transposase
MACQSSLHSRVLHVARASYRARTAIGDKCHSMRPSMTDFFESNHCCYGYLRRFGFGNQEALLLHQSLHHLLGDRDVLPGQRRLQPAAELREQMEQQRPA